MVWKWIRQRSLLGSDAVIVAAMVVHVYEASLFVTDSTSFGSIGMAALLVFFGRMPWVAAASMAAVVAVGAVGQWAPHVPPFARLILLAPQLTLFFVTALAAVFAVLHGSYADCIQYEECVHRSANFIASDQVYRMAMPFLYVSAIIARARSGGPWRRVAVVVESC